MILLTRDDFVKMFEEQIKPSYNKADTSVVDRAYDIYLSTSMEELNVKRNKEEQQSEATMLMQQLHLIDLQEFSTNDYLSSVRRLENQFRDIRKFTYFDNFLYKGASDDILKVLKQYNISTKALQGLKPSLPFDGVTWTSPDGKQVRIVQVVTKKPSIIIEDFDIYYDGKKIYSLSDHIEKKYNYEEEEPKSDEDYPTIINIKEAVEKALKETKKGYVRTINIEETNGRTFSFTEKVYEYEYDRINKDNIHYTQTIYRNSKGWFAKNPYRR